MASQTLPRLGWLASHALKWLSWWIGHYEACALLDAYRVFLLDREGFDRFLPPSPRRSLLDVGVGTGDVHLELAPL
ncbi:MAG: hypothetical protein N2515_07235, partial [Deltaproteobacteria bacterium]|nr:hypothetical protein [Deltaproteobacteria bacterium]